MTALNKQALTDESARESGNILLIVAARMARRELFTPLHYVSGLPQKVVGMRVFREALEQCEEALQREVCRIVDGHNRMAKKLKEAEAKLEAAEKRMAELEAREIKQAKGEVLVVVSGFTGCGKSAIAGEIEIAMKAIGVPVRWTNGDAEKRMTGADWLTAIEMYKPTVRIVEVNVPRAAGIGVKGE